MSDIPRRESAIVRKQLLRQNEKESESELNDQGSETFDLIIPEESQSTGESRWSDSEKYYRGQKVVRVFQLNLAGKRKCW